MLGRVKKIVALRIMTLLVSVILLPFVSNAATSPIVSVLSQLTQGLRVPVKIALDAVGNIYVADARAGGIVKFNTFGVRQMMIATAAVPNGLAFALDGTLLVSQGTSVIRYDAASGQEVGRLSGGDLKGPAGIAIDDLTGYIYVVDGLANQVVVYTASGDYVKAFAQGVTVNALGNVVLNPLGMLSRPSGISFERISRQFAVADTYSNRVQFFDPDGNFVKSIGKVVPINTTGSTTVIGSMQFEMPVATVFEYSTDQAPVTLKRIYIVDSFQSNIQVVDPATSAALLVAGTTKNYIGSSGTDNGKLMLPSDAVFDAVNKRLMVVNGYGNITNYGIDGGSNPTDTTSPTFSIDAVPATVSVPNVTISGSVEAGASVSVVTGSTTVAGAVVYTSSTTWKSDITGLVSGDNTIAVTATDAAGNKTEQSVNVALLVSAPVLTVSSSVPTLTNIPDLVISGTVDAGAIVAVTNNSTAVSGTALVIDGNWTYRVALAESTNDFTITAQKPMSTTSTATVRVTLDSIPPVLAVSSLSDGSYTSNQVQNVAGTVSDTGTVSILVNNVPASLVTGSFSVPVSLVTGTNTITVVAGDAAGNVSVNSRTLYFDASKPQITIAAPMDNSYTSIASLQIIGSVDKEATISVAGVTAVVDDSNNWSTNIELSAGLNTIEVVATDRYGNVSTQKRSITLDSVKPMLAVASPAQDVALNQSSTVIIGTVNDDNTTTLTYSLNGRTTSVPVDSGSFAFKVDFAGEGIYPVVITATDPAGNSTTATRSLIYDATPPAIEIAPVIATVFSPGVTISGTVEVGASVVVTIDAATAAGAVVYPAATTWKSDITGLAAGNNTITVTALDAAGNAAPAQSLQVTYLLPAPTMNVSSSVPSLTNAKDFVLSGTVDEGATVTVTNDSTSVSGTAAVIGGSWTYRVALAEGANNITITAQKPMSVKATVTVGLTLDSIPPVLAVSTLSDGSYTSNQVQNITGTASDTGAVTVLVNNVPANLVNGSFSVPVSLVTGTNTITVVAGDIAGNVTANSRTLHFDTTKPQINIAAPMDNSYTNNAGLQISGTVDKVATITVAGVPAVVDGSNNWSANVELVAGLNTIEVVATDLYGNSSTLKRSITLDTAKPVLAISSPVQDVALNSSSVTITGSVSEEDAIALTYSVNGKTIPVPVVAGSFTFKIDFAAEGIYPVAIAATDLAGNRTTATRSVIYDVTPPLLTLDSAKWQARALGEKLGGTVEAGATVTVKEDGNAIGMVIVNGNIWSADLSGISYNQTKLSVVATDAAGNSTSRILKANGN